MFQLVDPARADELAPLDRAVPAGTSLLLSGPAMTQTSGLMAAVLATGHGAGENVVPVSTEDSAETVRDRIAEFVDIEGAGLGAVDCTGRPTGEGLSRSGRVQYVPSPSDLTGIGIGITRAMEAVAAREGRYRLGFDSLSTLLTYRSTKDVFKFCHVLVSRIDGLDSCAVMTLDTNAHDERTVNTIARAFDGSIEVRDAPSHSAHNQFHEVRLRGLDAAPEWQPIELP